MIDRFAFYGSLRQGCYNNARMLGDSAKFVEKIQIRGYKMYDLGAYPAVVRDKDGVITVELFEITDEMKKQRIDGMEIGAGYKRTNVWWAGKHYILYVMTPPRLFDRSYPEVASGDWVSYLNITRQNVNGSTLRREATINTTG